MPDTHQISVTLTEDLAAAVARKVESGEFASASDLLLEGVLSVLERDEQATDAASHAHSPAFQEWMRQEVLAAHAEYLADPSKAVPIEDIEAWISARLDHPSE